MVLFSRLDSREVAMFDTDSRAALQFHVGFWDATTDLAGVAQLAEQLFCKQQVAGSSPIVGSMGRCPSG